MPDRPPPLSSPFRIAGLALVAGFALGCRPPASAEPAAPSDAAQAGAASAEAPATASTPSAAAEELGWTLLAEEDGIRVTSRASARSPVPVFRGVGVVPAPLVDVLAVITDADRHHEWVFSCSDSALLERPSEARSTVYLRTKTPWPVPDRDVVLDSQLEAVDGAQEVIVRFFAAEHPSRPPLDGVVRMPYLAGHYHLRAESGGATHVEYQVDSDPGGSLPGWLATRGTRDMPLKTLQGLRAQLAKTRGRYGARIETLERLLRGPTP